MDSVANLLISLILFLLTLLTFAADGAVRKTENNSSLPPWTGAKWPKQRCYLVG